jgi:hypothetical protein
MLDEEGPQRHFYARPEFLDNGDYEPRTVLCKFRNWGSSNSIVLDDYTVDETPVIIRGSKAVVVSHSTPPFKIRGRNYAFWHSAVDSLNYNRLYFHYLGEINHQFRFIRTTPMPVVVAGICPECLDSAYVPGASYILYATYNNILDEIWAYDSFGDYRTYLDQIPAEPVLASMIDIDPGRPLNASEFLPFTF